MFRRKSPFVLKDQQISDKQEVVSFLGVVVPAGLTLDYNIAQCHLQYSNNGCIKQVNGYIRKEMDVYDK